jgi:hypothetical protein
MAEFTRLVIARRVKILLQLNDAIYPAGVPTHPRAARALESPDAA